MFWLYAGLANVVLELFFEDCSCLADAGLYCAERDFHDDGDFAIFVSADEQPHDSACVAGKVVDGAVYLVDLQAFVTVLVGEWGGVGCVVDDECVLFFLCTVDECVVHDGARPIVELLGVAIKTAGTAERTCEYLLQQIISSVSLPR